MDGAFVGNELVGRNDGPLDAGAAEGEALLLGEDVG